MTQTLPVVGVAWPVLVLVLLAGVGAGAINTLVGSGTLLTFPVLIAAGLPPVSANVTNNIGLVTGSVTGAWGYRRELAGQGRRLAVVLPAAAVGGLAGALALLVLPPEVFGAVVPALVGLGVLLVVLQPWLARRTARRLAGASHDGTVRHGTGRLVALAAGVAATSVYGGYFGAAQGVILMGVLGALLVDGLQRLNGVKNAIAATVNLVAAVVFVVVSPEAVDWPLVVVVGLGAVTGAALAARYGRRLPPAALRGIIVVVGVVAVVTLVRS